jgi:transcription initiation factor IIF auxiliary subunit
VRAKASCFIPSNDKEGTKTPQVVHMSKRPRQDDEDTSGPSKRPKTVDEVTDEDKEGEDRGRQLRPKTLSLAKLVFRLLKATEKAGEELAKQRNEDLQFQKHLIDGISRLNSNVSRLISNVSQIQGETQGSVESILAEMSLLSSKLLPQYNLPKK